MIYRYKKIVFLLLGSIIVLVVTGCFTEHAGRIEVPTSNLPIVIIDTFGQRIPNEPKIPARIKIIYDQSGGRNALNSQHVDFEGKIGIELRGKPHSISRRSSTALKFRMIMATTKMCLCCNCQQNRIGF